MPELYNNNFRKSTQNIIAYNHNTFLILTEKLQLKKIRVKGDDPNQWGVVTLSLRDYGVPQNSEVELQVSAATGLITVKIIPLKGDTDARNQQSLVMIIGSNLKPIKLISSPSVSHPED